MFFFLRLCSFKLNHCYHWRSLVSLEILLFMSRYKKGDRVEVLNTTLEHSWHPARIVEGLGELYTVQIDGHTYGSVVLVLVDYIRPCPPVVEFSNWSRGDLVHVFDNFAWKLATVLQVLEKKHLTVRVIGSMLDLIVGAAWIRVRHCWQDGRWIVVGKVWYFVIFHSSFLT